MLRVYPEELPEIVQPDSTRNPEILPPEVPREPWRRELPAREDE